MADSDFGARLRELSKARDEGVISQAEFDQAKQRLLSGGPGQAPIAALKNVPALIIGAGLAVIAAVMLLEILRGNSYYDSDSMLARYALPVLTTVAAGYASFMCFTRRRVGIELVLALPISVVSIWITGFGFELLLEIAALVAIAVMVGLSWDSLGWTPKFEISWQSIVSTLSSLCLAAFLFVGGWTYRYYETKRNSVGIYVRTGEFSDTSVGDLWSTSSLKELIVSVMLLLAFSTPLIAITSGRRRPVGLACSSLAAALFGLYLQFFMWDDSSFSTLTLRPTIALFAVGFVGTAVLAVVNLLPNTKEKV